MKKDQKKFLELFRRLQLSVETRRRIRTIIAVIVVFATTYSLVLPAITLESNSASKMAGLNLSGQSGRELGCHFNMHKHTDACYKEVPVYDADGVQYTTKKVLSCGKADWIVHTHDENCYQNGQLVCTLPEHAEHIHNADCYTRQRVLSCGKEENPGHQHTDACYEETRELVCGQQEHVHTDACYTSDDGNEENAERQLICGKEEHIHTDECYKTEKNLICGMEEEEGHTHTDACYTEEDVLTCGEYELHTHNIDCFEKGPNGESPLEMGWVTLETDENGNEVLCGDPDHLICGKLELLAHQHDDSCFVQNDQQAVDAETEEIDADAGIDSSDVEGETDVSDADAGMNGTDVGGETDALDAENDVPDTDVVTDESDPDANLIFMDPEAPENQGSAPLQSGADQKQSQPGGIQSGTAKARAHLERTQKDRMPGCACWRSDPIRLPGFLHFPCFQPCFPLSRIPLIPKDGYTDPIAGAGFQRSFQALASHIQVSTFFLGQYSSLLVEQPDSDVLRPLAGCIGHLERNRQKGQLIANGFL